VILDTNKVEQTVTYGRALAAVIRASDVLLPQAGWFEQWLLKLLRAAYQRRLRALIAVLPGDVGDDILLGK
jgi:hypothetical protein